MAKFLVAYHGGEHGQADVAKVMDAWRVWVEASGDALFDSGNPVGMSCTMHPDRSISEDGGSNPISGYGIVEAVDRDAAIAIMKSCPHLDSNGTIELAPLIDIM